MSNARGITEKQLDDCWNPQKREWFAMWADSVLHSNQRMAEKLYYHFGISADATDVRRFDTRAAELLTKARAAHDELAAYLRSRKGGG